MNNTQFFLYLLIMSGVTYLIRALPFALITKKIENKTIRSFLYYIPYAVLSAMTVPAVFYATSNPVSALAGFAAAVIFSLKGCSLTTVAVIACACVYVAELFV